MDREMLHYLPGVIREIQEFQYIIPAQQVEIEKLNGCIGKLLENLFIESSDQNGIARFEQLLKIKPGIARELETRKAEVLAKWNNFIPYTYRVLEEKLKQLCGEGGYKILLEGSAYELDVYLKEKSTQILKVVTKDVTGMVPANLLLRIIGCYLNKAGIDADTLSRCTCRSDYYPRFNLEHSDLDGSWMLNGTYLLNGYKTDRNLDFYPVILTVATNAYKDIRTSTSAAARGNAVEQTRASAKMGMLCKAMICEAGQSGQAESEIGMGTGAAMQLETESHLVAEKDLWYVDGIIALDGSRLLDAEILEYEL